MSLSTSFFQKELFRLTIEDVNIFFQEEQEETSTLEFKSGEVSLEKVLKEVCAFLNTEGGLLLLGAPEEIEINKRRVCVGKPIACSLIKTEHSLMQSIASNISPAPTGIKCKSLPLGDGYVFVLEISQSINPPHQVNKESKYYIRLDKEAKAAPHGIVEALFFRRIHQELIGSIHLTSFSILKDTAGEAITFKVKVPLTLENIGSRPISIVKIVFGITLDANYNPDYILDITREWIHQPFIIKSGDMSFVEMEQHIRVNPNTNNYHAEHAETIMRRKSYLLVTEGVLTTTSGENIRFKMSLGKYT